MSSGREAYDLHNPACRKNAKKLITMCWRTTKTTRQYLQEQNDEVLEADTNK